MMRRLNTAIDGPAGAGKSTVARLVAEKLGYIYTDTGAMYRAVTLQALLDKINMEDDKALTKTAESINLAFEADAAGTTRIFMHGRDVTEELRTPLVSSHVSLVSRVPGVREKMVGLQREIAIRGGVVMEGRDIGTHVLPQAPIKLYLTATVEKRARRRYEELKQRGYNIQFADVRKEIKLRDEIDSQRAVAPLKPASDAIIIDCSDMGVNQVVDLILARVSGRAN